MTDLEKFLQEFEASEESKQYLHKLNEKREANRLCRDVCIEYEEEQLKKQEKAQAFKNMCVKLGIAKESSNESTEKECV